MALITATTTNSILQKINKEIKRVRENQRNLQTEADKITGELCAARDPACEERYQARIQNNATKGELQKRQNEFEYCHRGAKKV